MKKEGKGKERENNVTSDDILGKDVIDIDGRIIGVTDKLLFNQKSLSFTGISVDKGILKRGIYIGKKNIKRLTEHAIFLNTRVLYELKGMKVYDNRGKKIGKVNDIEIDDDNKLKSIIVKKTFRKINIPAKFINSMEYNILLKVGEKEISNKNKT